MILLLVLIGRSSQQDSRDLPVVGSFDHLKRLIKKAPHTHYQEFCRTCHHTDYSIAHPEPGITNKGEGAPYSIMFTARQGQHLFVLKSGDGIRRSRLIITRVLPVGKMKIERIMKIPDPRFEPFRWIVRDKRLIILGYRSYRPRFTGHSVLRAMVYDISKPRTPRKMREIEIEGSLLSVRKIGSTLWFWLEENVDFEDAVPSDDTFVYKDSATSQKLQHFGYDRIKYFKELPQHSFLVVGALDLNTDQSPFNISAFLGGADAVSMTKNNAYVMTTKFVPYELTKGQQELKPEIRKHKERPVVERTLIYRFSVVEGKLIFQGHREINGSIDTADQLAGDSEQLGIVTMTNQHWLKRGTDYNNVFIMNRKLKTVKKRKKIVVNQNWAQFSFFDEGIFRSSDDGTLTVLDSKNLKQLGKEHGFEWDWLNEDVFMKWRKKKVIRIQTGRIVIGEFSPMVIRLSILDLSSGQPREEFGRIIGDWGPDYDIYLGTAPVFDKKRSLLAFPVTAESIVGSTPFEGAYVYTVDPKTGFKQRGIINYFRDADIERLSNLSNGVIENLAIQKMFLSGNYLFTVSEAEVKALDIKSLKKVKRFKLPIY